MKEDCKRLERVRAKKRSELEDLAKRRTRAVGRKVTRAVRGKLGRGEVKTFHEFLPAKAIEVIILREIRKQTGDQKALSLCER